VTRFPHVHFVRLDPATHEALLAITGRGTRESMSGYIRRATRIALGTQKESEPVALTTNPPTNTHSAPSAPQVPPMSIECYQSILSPSGYRVHPTDAPGWEFTIEAPSGQHVPCKMRQKQLSDQYRLSGIRADDEGRYILAIGPQFYLTPCVSLIDPALQADGAWETWISHAALVPIGDPIRPTPDYPVYPRR
jgi:hypothetical protein